MESEREGVDGVGGRAEDGAQGDRGHRLDGGAVAPRGARRLSAEMTPFAAALAAAARVEATLAKARAAAAIGSEPEAPRISEAAWRELWERLEREEALPARGWEPDESDPASPDSSPEVAEWERHWPTEPTFAARTESAPRGPALGTALLRFPALAARWARAAKAAAKRAAARWGRSGSR